MASWGWPPSLPPHTNSRKPHCHSTTPRPCLSLQVPGAPQKTPRIPCLCPQHHFLGPFSPHDSHRALFQLPRVTLVTTSDLQDTKCTLPSWSQPCPGHRTVHAPPDTIVTRTWTWTHHRGRQWAGQAPRREQSTPAGLPRFRENTALRSERFYKGYGHLGDLGGIFWLQLVSHVSSQAQNLLPLWPNHTTKPSGTQFLMSVCVHVTRKKRSTNFLKNTKKTHHCIRTSATAPKPSRGLVVLLPEPR